MPRRKTVTFDLSVDKLKTVYAKRTGNNYISAYGELRRAFERHGFVHQDNDGSVYTSIKGMSKYTVEREMTQIFNELPWLPQCAKSMNMHDYISSIDLLKPIFEQLYDRENLSDVENKHPPRDISGDRDER